MSERFARKAVRETVRAGLKYGLPAIGVAFSVYALHQGWLQHLPIDNGYMLNSATGQTGCFDANCHYLSAPGYTDRFGQGIFGVLGLSSAGTAVGFAIADVKSKFRELQQRRFRRQYRYSSYAA